MWPRTYTHPVIYLALPGYANLWHQRSKSKWYHNFLPYSTVGLLIQTQWHTYLFQIMNICCVMIILINGSQQIKGSVSQLKVYSVVSWGQWGHSYLFFFFFFFAFICSLPLHWPLPQRKRKILESFCYELTAFTCIIVSNNFIQHSRLWNKGI